MSCGSQSFSSFKNPLPTFSSRPPTIICVPSAPTVASERERERERGGGFVLLLLLLVSQPYRSSTMSWQNYVDDHLMCALPSGHTLTSAAIIGVEGSVWASSDKFPEIKPQEITDIVNAFNDSSTLAQHGLFIGGAKYLVLQGEQGVVIRGKKGAGGVTIKKTNLALVFGIYDEPVTPPECNTIVEKLGDYLLDQGF